MRVKQLWNYVPIPSSSKLVWDRITFSQLTIAYFTLSIVHFILQLSFQIKAFRINADAATFLSNIVVQGNGTSDSLPILSGNTLHLCSWVSSNLNLDGDSCPVVWNGTKGTNIVNNTQSDESFSYQISSGPSMAVVTPSPSLSSSAINIVAPASGAISDSTTLTTVLPSTSTVYSSTIKPSVTAISSLGPSTVTVFVTATSLPSPLSSNDDDDDDDAFDRRRLFERDAPQIVSFEENGGINLNISGLGFKDSVVTLDSSCVLSLNWPVSTLRNTKREDIVFMAFQFWVLGMSVVALLNESIPHILASLVTHMMATGWAGFQIQHTANFKADFTRVITEGACDGVSLLPNYWHDRGIAEITSLAFNALALLISSFLTWRLFKTFGWQTFKRVGASLTINRIYKIVLTLSITIQLSIFFMVAAVSLWLDRLFNSPIGDLVDFETLYKVSSFITLILLVPWLMTGWFAVRRELRVPMFIFLLLSILYLGGWGVMFLSTTFRWNFITWTFFSIMAIAAVLLTVASLVLGVVCRYNFGKGLPRYLNAQQDLPEDFEYYGGASDEEKVDFPSNEKLVPTYSSVFGAAPVLSLPYNAVEPRFSGNSVGPFDSAKPSPVTPPPNAYTVARKVSDSNGIVGADTRSSDRSFGTLASFYSYSGKGHNRSESQKRWVIE